MSDPIESIIVLIGVTLILVAFFVELEHRVIWENYKKHYHPHKNKWAEQLFKPNVWVYRFQVYFLWPVVFLLGLYILLRDTL
jgi:hypothetical protein